MKKLIAFLIAVIAANIASAQGCLPEGITFTTQAQIDSFQIKYPGCTEIEGDVTIYGENILNLDSLSVIQSIGGCLLIEYWSPSLTSLNGLNNLVSIGGDFRITGKTALTNLTGLENLVSVGGTFEIEETNSLRSLNGLENLKSVGGYFFIRNCYLNSLTGLENLTNIGESVFIYSNNLLSSLSALENLSSIGKVIHISSNPMLTSLEGLENIEAASITELSLYNNQTLSSCNVQNICNYLVSPIGVINIYSNAPGCNNPPEVANSCSNALSCLPYGNYIFNNQTDVDNFQKNYPNCTELKGDVFIGGDLTNLNGLNNIASVSGNLEINYSSTLTNLNGLGNLTFVGGDLTIRGGKTIWGGCIYPALTSLAGLEKLTSIGGGFSLSCLKINDFSGLGNLKSIGGDFDVHYTDINNFTGMENLSSIGGSFHLGFFGGADMNGIWGNNQFLTSFAGLNNLTFIGGSIQILGQQSLTSLTGLDNLDSISSGILIFGNPSLTTLAGLYNLTFIGGSLDVSVNDGLTNLTGLDNLTSIGGSLSVSENRVLTSLKGIENISSESIENLYITRNPMLYNGAIKSICDYLASPTGDIEISENATGCNSPAEVEAACSAVSVNDFILADGFSIYPDPATNKITISTNRTFPGETRISIFSTSGQQLVQARFQNQNKFEMDISALKKGIYLLKIQTNAGIETKKLVVQ